MCLIVKERKKSLELEYYQLLKPRLPSKKVDENQLNYLSKGFEGERLFDKQLAKLTAESLTIADLQLTAGQSFIQLDTVLIINETIYLFEVKNYSGEYVIEAEGTWLHANGREIKSPIVQLQRTEGIFRQLLQSLHLPRYIVKSFLVFPNEEFTLFNLPPDLPILLSSQIPAFLRKINSNSGPLTTFSRTLADKLLEQHQTLPLRFLRIPDYTFDELMKGIFCHDCLHLMHKISQRMIKCHGCGQVEKNSSALVREIRNFQMLFPNRKLQANDVYEWCGRTFATRTINRILKKLTN